MAFNPSDIFKAAGLRPTVVAPPRDPPTHSVVERGIEFKTGDVIRREAESRAGETEAAAAPHYNIVKLLGVGGFGKVYLARVPEGGVELGIGRLPEYVEVVIKVIDVKRAQDKGADPRTEVSALHHLSRSDGVIKIYDSFEQIVGAFTSFS